MIMELVPEGDGEDDPRATFLPTPEQIRESCEQIQATWPPGEELKRRAWTLTEVIFPAVSVLHADQEVAP